METPSGGTAKPGLPRRSHGEGGSFGSGSFTLLIWLQIDGGDMNLKWCPPNSQ
jgi:hypothetical protein